jgi:lysozyme
MTANGIDVSHYQGLIDWNKVKADPKKYLYAIMKCTENIDYADPTTARNVAGADSVEIDNSVYHFWRALSTGKKQAEWFLKHLPKMPKMPLVIDVEDSTNVPPDPSPDFARRCLVNIREMAIELEKAQGRRPIIYTGAWFWNRIANQYSIREPDGTYWWSKYDLWVASYTTNAPILPWGWTKWLLWQYSSKGVVSGINASCDLDYFNGDEIALKNFINAGVTPTVPPVHMVTVPIKSITDTKVMATQGRDAINQVITNLTMMEGL